ncbi:hypothetical protein BHM03_00047002 [Ensete ventricosum]|nr:hypothetical protein BHM03_00047002 [Ensete ventricosum]
MKSRGCSRSRCCSRSRYPTMTSRGEEQGECCRKQRMSAKICRGGLLLLELQGQLESCSTAIHLGLCRGREEAHRWRRDPTAEMQLVVEAVTLEVALPYSMMDEVAAVVRDELQRKQASSVLVEWERSSDRRSRGRSALFYRTVIGNTGERW